MSGRTRLAPEGGPPIGRRLPASIEIPQGFLSGSLALLGVRRAESVVGEGGLYDWLAFTLRKPYGDRGWLACGLGQMVRRGGRLRGCLRLLPVKGRLTVGEPLPGCFAGR